MFLTICSPKSSKKRSSLSRTVPRLPLTVSNHPLAHCADLPYALNLSGIEDMKCSATGLALLAMGFLPPAVHAQAPPVQPYIQMPIPGYLQAAPPPRPEYDRGWWEHCEHLRHQAHEMRERLRDTPPYNEERERLEHRRREVYHEREWCGER